MATPLETLILSETGLVALYLLNETTGTVATDVKGANNGVYQNGGTGGYTLNQAGIIASETNNCPTFVNAHTGCVTIPTGLIPTGNNPYTWEAWVDPTSAAISNMHVFGADNATPNGPALMFDKPNNQWHTWRASPANQLSAAAGPISTFYHIVKTYDGKTLRLTVNGQSRGGVVDTTSIGTVATSFIIGATGGFGASWEGKIQYAAIYNVALTGAQIRKHYLTGLTTLPAANNNHFYETYVNTGQSWDASPPTSYTELDTWTNWATNNGATTHKPGVFHCFQNYANNAHFPVALAQQANQRGANLMVTWEAWDPGAAGTGGKKADQPTYALQNIILGNFDNYLTTWANDIKAYGQPVFLRLFHEFNGDYYPWGIVLDANNNSQSDYIVGGVLSVNTEARVASAFQHVRTVFNNAGVTNVKWVWCPNIFLDNFSNNPFTSASYPGDTFVDYAGLDGYNVGGNSSTSPWLTFFDLYSQAYDVIAAATNKPIIVPEMACAEDSAAFYTKAGWITQALGTDIPQAFPAIVGFAWEDDVNYPAFPSTIGINSSPAALSAFQAQIAGTGYAVGIPLAFAAPTLSSLSPTSATAGGAGFTLTVNGSGFASGSQVFWGTNQPVTTFVSSTQITAAIPGSYISTATTVTVTATNTGSAASNGLSFTVSSAPIPTLTSISPTSATTNSSFTLTATGTNFTSGSAITWAGTALVTTFISSTSLSAAVGTSQTNTNGTYAITVTTPSRSTTSALSVTVAAAATPSISSITPTTAVINSVFTLSVAGSNFVSGSTVSWAGTALATTFVSSTALTATVTTSQTNTLGSYSITVVTSGLATSNSATITVTNPTPQITSISPNSAVVGSGPITLTVNGVGFVSTSVVYWNNTTALTTTYVSAGQITAVIPASPELASAGSDLISVKNP